jgi:uncharacterized protein (DUF983 family)
MSDLKAPTYSVKSERSLMTAMLHGLRGRCPHCGEGRLFARYLKIANHCPACGEALHHHRADDAPPYFTILIAGHVIVPLLLAFEIASSRRSGCMPRSGCP